MEKATKPNQEVTLNAVKPAEDCEPDINKFALVAEEKRWTRSEGQVERGSVNPVTESVKLRGQALMVTVAGQLDDEDAQVWQTPREMLTLVETPARRF